jgi:hypothetical protein
LGVGFNAEQMLVVLEWWKWQMEMNFLGCVKSQFELVGDHRSHAEHGNGMEDARPSVVREAIRGCDDNHAWAV